MGAIKLNVEDELNQRIASFLSRSSIGETYHIDFNKNITYEDFLTNKLLIIAAIREGIPYSLFDSIQEYAPFTENDWANFLDISTKSLQRYKAKSATEYSFKPIHSEKIIEITEVTKLGLDVFGNIDKFRLWLKTPNYALGNLKPIDLLKDSYGKELVMNELTHINFGIFA